MMTRLTDDDIRNDASFYHLIEEYRELLRQMGWSDATLVEQYNIVISLSA
jgi:hypothetical protein